MLEVGKVLGYVESSGENDLDLVKSGPNILNWDTFKKKIVLYSVIVLVWGYLILGPLFQFSV